MISDWLGALLLSSNYCNGKAIRNIAKKFGAKTSVLPSFLRWQRFTMHVDVQEYCM